MKELYYTYNNEAIASCIMLKVIQKVKVIDPARSCLILPFLLDDGTVSFLQKNINSDLSLENLVKYHPRLFTSFYKRYLALLPVSINSLIILHKANQILIASDISTKTSVELDDLNMGERFKKINHVLPFFLTMIERYTTVQLYKLLKIQL